MRSASISRKTNETDIKLTLNLDGNGKNNINSGCGFFDHMLQLFSKHSRVDLDVKCDGDTNVDYHHSIEDIGIVLGTALNKALGEKKGIMRYADIILPMDETLVMEAIDFSGRAYLSFDVSIPSQKVGEMDTELVEEFFMAFVRSCCATLHIKLLDGKNSHHIIEAVFKAFGRIIKEAVKIDPARKDEIPSSKGVL